jgi:hypothetical protein
MTKKVLELFADKIKNEVPYLENQRMVADAVIDVTKKVNPRFNEKKFLKACGLTFEVEY